MSAYTDVGDEGWHIVPMDDLRPHETSHKCWCRPTQDEDEPAVWVHHSLDGRECSKEQGRLQ